MKLAEVLKNTGYDENAVATDNVTRKFDSNELSKVSDDDLAAELNARSYFSQSDGFVFEFERRLVVYGAPRARVAAAQIDYIVKGETIKDFAKRLRDDSDF
jgi:hypothetical protein